MRRTARALYMMIFYRPDPASLRSASGVNARRGKDQEL
jgi:hypothetical protein